MTAVSRRVVFNVPNTLCWVRLAGSPVLPVLAWRGAAVGFVAWFIVLYLIDTIDGRLARRLHQRTRFGARLDTIADATLFACAALGVWLLRPQLVADQAWWFVAAGLSYALSVVVSYARFGRWPSYHTRMAKITGTVVAAMLIVVVLRGEAWPVWIACAMACLTNLEAAAISGVLRRPRTDVPGIHHAWRDRSAL